MWPVPSWRRSSFSSTWISYRILGCRRRSTGGGAAFAAQCSGGSLASPIARLGRQMQRFAHVPVPSRLYGCAAPRATPPGMTLRAKKRRPFTGMPESGCVWVGGRQPAPAFGARCRHDQRNSPVLAARPPQDAHREKVVYRITYPDGRYLGRMQPTPSIVTRAAHSAHSTPPISARTTTWLSDNARAFCGNREQSTRRRKPSGAPCNN